MDEDAGFWPAYVAAIAGLIQGLLLVLAVMAIALVQVVSVICEPAEAMAEAGQERVEPEQAAAELEIEFSNWAWRVDESTRLAIEKAAQSLVGRGAQQWRLVLTANLNSSLARRVAYLRMTMVRSVLMGAGVKGAQIDMVLVDSPDGVSEEGGQTLKVQTQNHPPAPGATQ